MFLLPLKVDLDAIVPAYLLDALSESLCIRYNYMPLIVFITGGFPPYSVTIGDVTVFFSRFCITVFLASIGRFSFYLV